MSSYTLDWPGMASMPVFIIDPVSNKLFSQEKPLPADKLDLDIFENKHVKLSSVLNLFASQMQQESEWVLRELQNKFNLKKVSNVTTKICQDGQPPSRQVTTYLPVTTLLAFVMTWPCCRVFQSTRKAVFSYLEHYSDMICSECGYVHRECKCDRVRASLPSSGGSGTFLGYGTKVVEKGCQTDPIILPSTNTGYSVTPSISNLHTLSGGNNLNSGQGISLLLPQGVKLQPGMKVPLSLTNPVQFQNNTSFTLADVNSGNFNILRMPASTGSPVVPQSVQLTSPGLMLPPSLPAKRFRSLLNPPVTPIVTMGSIFDSTSSPGPSAFWNSWQTASSKSSPVPFKSDILPSGVNYIRPIAPVVATSIASTSQTQSSPLSIVYRISQTGAVRHPDNKKRKYEKSVSVSESNMTETKSVMVNGQSLVKMKKCKIREDGDEAISAKPLNSDIAGETNASDFVEQPGTSRQSSVDLTLKSTPDTVSNKEDKDFSGRKSVRLWKLIEDNADSDEEFRAGEFSLKTFNVKGQSQSETKSLDLNKSKIVVTNNVGEEKSSDKTEITDTDPNKRGDEALAEKTSNGLDPLNSSMETESVDLDDKEGIVDGFGKLEKDENSKIVDETPGKETVNKMEVDEHMNECDEKLSGNKADGLLKDHSGSADSNSVADVKAETSVKSTEMNQNGDTSIEDSVTLKEPSESCDPVKTESVLDNCQPETVCKKMYGKFEYLPTGEHIFRCFVIKCGQCFDTRQAAEVHSIVHPQNENINHYQCPKCEFKAPFYHWYDLLRHLRTVHEIHMNRALYSCKYCGLVFDKEDKLSSHIDFHYSNRYKCVHCGLLLLTWKQVQRHLETCTDKHRGNVNLGCPFCTFVFHKKNIRNLHLLSHSDVGLSCALCQDNVAWSDWKTLRKHYQQKHAKLLLGKITPFRHNLPLKRKPPRCRKCDVEFKGMELYSNHMCRAHDLVPYTLIECVQCERRFRTEKSHDWHVKHVHVQELSCDKCSYTTTSKSLLKLHMTQKHSDKQHACSECEKSFSYFHQLKVHMAHHARRTIYSCTLCDQEFSRNADLRTHQATDHADVSEKAPQSCPECEFRCFSRSTLNVHVRKNHPELMEDESDEDGADHCYFNRNVDMPSPPPPPKIRKVGMVGVGRGRGRRKKSSRMDWEMSRRDNYIPVEDRRERRRLKRLQKEEEEKLKKLKKMTCARTRCFEEHRSSKNQAQQAASGYVEKDRTVDMRLHLSRVARNGSHDEPGGTVTAEGGAVSYVPSGALAVYPYLDHNYFKPDQFVDVIPLEAPVMTSAQSRIPGGKSTLVVDGPDVSAFQECETMMLGLGNRREPVGQSPRPLQDARKRFTSILESVSSASGPNPVPAASRLVGNKSSTVGSMEVSDYDLENLSSEITELDVLAETELLKSTGGYNLIQDILSSCVPSSLASSTPGRNVNHDTVAGDASFGDNLPLENNVENDEGETLVTDLDDIELFEDDYNLFRLQGSSEATNGNEQGSQGNPSSTLQSLSAAISLLASPGAASRRTAQPGRRPGTSPRRTPNFGSSTSAKNYPPLSTFNEQLSPTFIGKLEATSSAGVSTNVSNIEGSNFLSDNSGLLSLSEAAEIRQNSQSGTGDVPTIEVPLKRTDIHGSMIQLTTNQSDKLATARSESISGFRNSVMAIGERSTDLHGDPRNLEIVNENNVNRRNSSVTETSVNSVYKTTDLDE